MLRSKKPTANYFASESTFALCRIPCVYSEPEKHLFHEPEKQKEKNIKSKLSLETSIKQNAHVTSQVYQQSYLEPSHSSPPNKEKRNMHACISFTHPPYIHQAFPRTYMYAGMHTVCRHAYNMHACMYVLLCMYSNLSHQRLHMCITTRIQNSEPPHLHLFSQQKKN